jgi:predicted Zn-dependent peptidase
MRSCHPEVDDVYRKKYNWHDSRLHQKTTFQNGLRIISDAMPHSRSVSLVFFLKVGSCYENEAQSGISHFIEHLCFKGTEKRRSAQEISEAIEGTGGIINGGTDKEITTYWCKVASNHLSLALDVLVDLVCNPRFDQEDIDNERGVIIEEIRMSIDSPRQRVDMLIDELLWPEHPLGRDIAGTEETVGALQRPQIRDFFFSHYTPDNIVISVAGDVEHAMLQDTLFHLMGTGPRTTEAVRIPFRNEQFTPRLCVEQRDIEQVHINMGFPGLSLEHPDRFAVDLLNIILGGGMSSRLFSEIRERRGLAYDVNSCADHFLDTGSFLIYAGVNPQRLDDTLKAIAEQLDLLKNVSIREDEVTRAKEKVKGRLMLAFEDSRNVANWLGAQEVLTGHIYTLEEIVSRVEEITPGDLQRIANSLFVNGKINLALVGPVGKDISLDHLLA